MRLITCILPALPFPEGKLFVPVYGKAQFSTAEGSTFDTAGGWKLVISYPYVYNVSVGSPGGFCSLWSHVGSSRSCLESTLQIKSLTKSIRGTWGGCWKIQREGMYLVLKQWLWSCLEKLRSCFCRERDEITHPNRRIGLSCRSLLKRRKKACRAELLLLVKVLIHPPNICSLISSIYGLLHESKLHTGLGQVSQNWWEERGIHLQTFWICAPTQDFGSSCSYLGRVSRVAQVGQRFPVQGKQAFSLKGRNKHCFVFFTPVFCLHWPTAAFRLKDLLEESGWLWAMSLCHNECLISD